MFAKDALDEIAQWHWQTGAVQHELDWRWVERFRTLTAALPHEKSYSL